MSEENIRLLVAFYRLIKFYEFDERHKGNTDLSDNVRYFYEVVIELAEKITKEKNILELSTPKIKKFAEVIRYLIQEDELEVEVISVFCKLLSLDIEEDERERLNFVLRDPEQIKKYKG